MSDGDLARNFTKNNVNTFRNLRKVHDAMKRRSGEGLATVAPDKNTELLAMQRAQLLGEKLPVIASKKRIPLPKQNAPEVGLLLFPDTRLSSDDTSDNELLMLQPKLAKREPEPAKREPELAKREPEPVKREPELVKRLSETVKPLQLLGTKQKSEVEEPPAKHTIVEFKGERMTAFKALMKQQAYYQEIQAKQQNDFLNLMKSILQAPIAE